MIKYHMPKYSTHELHYFFPNTEVASEIVKIWVVRAQLLIGYVEGETNLNTWMMKLSNIFFFDTVGGYKKNHLKSLSGRIEKNCSCSKIHICTRLHMHSCPFWSLRKRLVVVKFTSLLVCTCACF